MFRDFELLRKATHCPEDYVKQLELVVAPQGEAAGHGEGKEQVRLKVRARVRVRVGSWSSLWRSRVRQQVRVEASCWRNWSAKDY